MNLDNREYASNVDAEKGSVNSILPPVAVIQDGTQKNIKIRKSKSKLKPPKPLGRMINLPPAIGYGNLFPSDSKVNSNYQDQRVTNNDRSTNFLNKSQQNEKKYGIHRDKNLQGALHKDNKEKSQADDTWLWSQERKVQEDVIEMITEKCSKLSYKIESLQQENDHLNRKLGTKENSLYNLKSEYQQQINELRNTEKDLLCRIKSMELSMQSNIDDKGALEADVSRLTGAFAVESDKLSSVQEELRIFRRNYEAILAEATQYKEEINRCRNLRDDLIEKDDIIKKYEEQVELLVDELETYKTENIEIVNTAKQNEETTKHFETKVRTYQEHIKALKTENKELKQKMAEQQTSFQKLADTYEKSNRELNDKMKQASTSSNNSVAHLKKSLREKDGKINTITVERDEQGKKIEMLTERVKRLTATIKDKNTIISNLQRLSEALESTNSTQKSLSQLQNNKASDNSDQKTPRNHRIAENLTLNKKQSPCLEKGSPNGWNNNFHRKGNSIRSTSTKNNKTERTNLPRLDRRKCTRRYTDPSQPPSISLMPESNSSTPLTADTSIEDPIAPFPLPHMKKKPGSTFAEGENKFADNQSSFSINNERNNSQNRAENVDDIPSSTESGSLRELRSKVSKRMTKNSSLASSFDNDDDVPIWMR